MLAEDTCVRSLILWTMILRSDVEPVRDRASCMLDRSLRALPLEGISVVLLGPQLAPKRGIVIKEQAWLLPSMASFLACDFSALCALPLLML